MFQCLPADFLEQLPCAFHGADEGCGCGYVDDGGFIGGEGLMSGADEGVEEGAVDDSCVCLKHKDLIRTIGGNIV